MSREKGNSTISVMLGSLGWPLALGLAACVVFYVLIHQGVLGHPLLGRYFAGHPIEYIEAAMFFVGLSALAMIGFDRIGQFVGLDRVRLSAIPPAGQQVQDASHLLAQLEDLPAGQGRGWLATRLGAALEHVRRKGSADDLDAELKHLSDVDADRQYQNFALVRIIIWATPMLGFLGTVIGITLALGNLSPEALVDNPKTAMDGLLGGLSIAFDTTTLALSLSIALMFAQFLISRIDEELLAAVDARAEAELVGRFQQLGTAADPHLASVRRMAETVVGTTEGLVRRQAEIWQDTIDQAHERWNTLVVTAGRQLEQSFSSSLEETLAAHASHLSALEQQAEGRTERQSERFEVSLVEHAAGLKAQQDAMARQAGVLLQVVEATGEVVKLETTLNDNLRALAGSKNFEDTVTSLAAAINMLGGRLARPADVPTKVDLDPSASQDRAA